MHELQCMMNELEKLLDELLLLGANVVPSSFFTEMKQQCERYGFSYASKQLQIMEEEQERSRFLHEVDGARFTEAFCKLQQYVKLVQLEMLHV